MEIAVKRFYISLVFPGILLLLIWLVFIVDQTLGMDLHFYGLYPRKFSGLQGILFAPFIHGDLKHIMANSIPLFVLLTALFYFYRDLAFRVFLLCFFVTGALVWIGARPAYHIGASGLVYGLAGFLIFSGLLRRHIGLIAISLIVVFQYGSMIWGIFPLEEKVSWESHLLGLLGGAAWAWAFRKIGPQGQDSLFWSKSKPETEDDNSELPWYEYEIEGDRKPQEEKPEQKIIPPEWETDWTRNH